MRSVRVGGKPGVGAEGGGGREGEEEAPPTRRDRRDCRPHTPEQQC